MKNSVITSNGKDLKEHIVSMSNQLMRASQRLNLNEKRIISACISLIDSRNEMSDEKYKVTKYRLYALDFGRLFGIDDKHAYEYLKKASDDLIERTGQYRHESGKGYTKFNWVDFVHYYEGEGVLEIAFGSVIKPFLHNLKREFTIYKLKNACNFKSVYTWRLYELLQSYKLKYLSQKLSTEMTEKHAERYIEKIKRDRHINHIQALEYIKKRDDEITKGRTLPNKYKISVTDLREQLDVPSSYTWQDVKRRAIETAIKEIKKVNQLEITYKIFKTGKAITSIQFEWKKEQQIDFIDELEREKLNI